MKKFALLLSLGLLASTATMAQDYKAKAGSKTFEFQLSPSGGANNFVGAFTGALNQPILRGRYFMTDAMAVRGGLKIMADNSTTYDNSKNKTERSAFELGLRPGLEWHFAGNGRFSPYWGAEVDIAIRSAGEKQTTDGGDNIVTLEGANNGGRRGGFGFGVYGVIGADYYITDAIYMGVEGSWGLGISNNADVKTKTGSGSEETTKGGGSFSMDNAVAAIRFGYRF